MQENRLETHFWHINKKAVKNLKFNSTLKSYEGEKSTEMTNKNTVMTHRLAALLPLKVLRKGCREAGKLQTYLQSCNF